MELGFKEAKKNEAKKNRGSRLLKENYKGIFGQKLSKIGHLGLKMSKNEYFLQFCRDLFFKMS